MSSYSSLPLGLAKLQLDFAAQCLDGDQIYLHQDSLWLQDVNHLK